jgi:predicted dithiol-disulfide oxidoreductase (DUF899 family)
MDSPKITTKEEWLKARLQLLNDEKALAQQADQVAAKRRELPWVKLDVDYVFESEGGAVSLSSLFEGRSQLIVQHFMFGPDWEAGCPFCSFWADGYDPVIIHMNQRNVSFAVVSRAPIEKLQAYRQRMGWSFKWVSALNNNFNHDFNVSVTAEETEAGRTTYNFRDVAPHSSEMHGISVFYKDEMGQVYHTYSAYARGVERMNAAYAYLDLVPKGRDESGLAYPLAWVCRHDEYESN